MCQHSAGTALARLSLYRAVPGLLMQHGGTNRHGTTCHRATVVPCLIVPCLIVLVLVSCWAARLAIYRLAVRCRGDLRGLAVGGPA